MTYTPNILDYKSTLHLLKNKQTNNKDFNTARKLHKQIQEVENKISHMEDVMLATNKETKKEKETKQKIKTQTENRNKRIQDRINSYL